MSKTELTETQKRIIRLAENLILHEKIDRSPILHEMTEMNQQLSTDEQLQVVMAISTAPALGFLAATGIRGDARAAMWAKRSSLDKEMRK